MYTCVNHQYHGISQRHCYLCEIDKLRDELAEANAERLEQARLLGISGSVAARQRAEVEALTKTLADLRADVAVVADENDTLHDENEALRADAERYQWMKQHARSHWDGTIGRPESWLFMGWPFSALRGATLDAAIDALAAGRGE